MSIETTSIKHTFSDKPIITYRHCHNKYMHGLGGSCTFAIRQQGDKLFFRVAVCNPKDNFCYAEGRELAELNTVDGLVCMKYNPMLSFKENIFFGLREMKRKAPEKMSFKHQRALEILSWDVKLFESV